MLYYGLPHIPYVHSVIHDKPQRIAQLHPESEALKASVLPGGESLQVSPLVLQQQVVVVFECLLLSLLLLRQRS